MRLIIKLRIFTAQCLGALWNVQVHCAISRVCHVSMKNMFNKMLNLTAENLILMITESGLLGPLFGMLIVAMKTPERWRALPRRALLVPIPNKKSF